MNWRPLMLAIICVEACGCGSTPQEPAGIPQYSYQVVRSFPHDPFAFTEGLFYLDGFLYEGTGLPGASSIRKVRLETGEVLQRRDVPDPNFGEGIVPWGDRLLELTWQGQVGFIYDLASFEKKGEFTYPGEGWSLTQNGKQIIMSDGTAELRFLDPATLREMARLKVTDDGRPLQQINELEWVKGEIFANVWHQDRIARIDPATGRVTGWIDLAGLWQGSDHEIKTLNGIAYDARGDRLFVTGKNWPRLFEIRVVRKE